MTDAATYAPGDKLRLHLRTPADCDIDMFDVVAQGDRHALILKAYPFQNSAWAGRRIALDSIERNQRPRFADGVHLNYAIRRVEVLERAS